MSTSALFAVFAFFFFATGGAGAQTGLDKATMGDYLSLLEKNDTVMGGLVIMREGVMEYEKYIGFSSVLEKRRITPATKFRIGSVTKTFTAVMIFRLIEEGKLTPETKLSAFFPMIPNAASITIDHLLGHRSGLHEFAMEKEYFRYHTFPKTQEEMVRLIAGFKPDFRPGSRSVYSNSNYVLLGYIIEKVTTSSYQRALEAMITSRAGLKSTAYGKKINPSTDEAFSYSAGEGGWVLSSETDMSIPHGAGAIVSTPRDLALFITALFDGKLVSRESLKRMQESSDIYLGKGLLYLTFAAQTAYGHGGGIDGFSSHLLYFPDERLAVALTMNGCQYAPKDIMTDIMAICHGIPAAIGILPDQAELQKYEGKFSSDTIAVTITLKVEGGLLLCRFDKQAAFPLTPFSKTEFKSVKRGITVYFIKNGEGRIDYDSFLIFASSGRQDVFNRE